MTLLGPSGCGKTTTLGLIAGFFAPTRGEIYIAGKPVAGLPPFKRDIGVVFQDYALFPHMSAGENVAFGLRMRDIGKSECEQRVRQALELVQLGALAARASRRRDRPTVSRAPGKYSRCSILARRSSITCCSKAASVRWSSCRTTARRR